MKKRILVIAFLVIGMIANAQVQTFFNQLRLNTVNNGSVSDSLVLVQGTDKIIRKVPLSSISSNLELPYVTPEEFGALGDGSTDDTTALQNAVNSGKTLLLGSKTYKVSNLLVTDSTTIIGLGNRSILYTTSNDNVIEITGNYNVFKNFKILGNSTGSVQNGFSAIGVSGLNVYRVSNLIEGVYISNLGGIGIEGQYVIGTSSGVNHEGLFSVSNTIINNCTYGVYLKTRAEYNSFNNCRIENCTNGFFFEGGNNSYIGGAVVNCTYGVKTLSGANDAHSQFSGTMINHNDYNVWTNHGSTYNFDGCSIYAGHIRVQGGTTKFTGCQISFGGGSFNYTQINATCKFTGCEFAILPTTVTITGDYPIIRDSFKGDEAMANIDSSYSKITTVTANATFTVPKGMYVKSIMVNNTTANAITGGLRIGTTSGGQEVVTDTAIDANFINSLSLVKSAFSTTADTTLYIQAVTDWNSASIEFIIDLESFKI